MKKSLPDIILEFLRERPEQRFTAQEIAIQIIENHPDKYGRKSLRQMESEVSARLRDLKKRYPEVKTTEGWPRKHYYTELTDIEEIEQAERNESSPASNINGSEMKAKESDLYPILYDFLLSERRIYSMRIDENRSRNSRGSGGNKWLHPDLVGMEDLSADWRREIKDCVGEYADKKTKLWSFEVKKLINRSNVRETFFQAVSNSSWANFGYLVACDLESAALKELNILSSLHGIGFIRLDVENPSESQIMIPAKERNEIDWDTANRLTEENEDFGEYIRRIRHSYQTGDIRQGDWPRPKPAESRPVPRRKRAG